MSSIQVKSTAARLVTAGLLLALLSLPLADALAAPGQATFTPVSSIPISHPTMDKPQSKVWSHADTWWAVLPSTTVSPSGTWLWKLGGDGSWSNVLRLSPATDTQADAKAVGDVTHILLYGASPVLASIEYVGGAYQPWSQRLTNTAISLPNSETATIDVDSTGRMWLATENGTNINVHHSDAPYDSFSAPVTLASGVTADDIGVVTALPSGKVGVLWSNQNTRLFGFRTHSDGADASAWSVDEQPASQSARNVGFGMADDHLNVAVASDGTLYAAVKTSYDTAGEARIALLVRRSNGTWDDLHEVDQAGTRPIVLLNEQEGSVRVVYTSSEGFNDIVMKTSSTSAIGFGARQTLITGGVNDVTSTKQNWTGKVLALASNATTAVGGFIDVTGTPANTAPVATNGTLSVAQGASAGGTLQATDANSDPLTYSIVSNGTKGTAVVTNAATGAYTYTANANANGSDSFTFKANDGTADSNTATVNVTISSTFVGHWKADEGSGTTLLDSSGSGNTATLFGNSTWVNGKIGQAVSFDGTGDYATVSHNPGLNMTNAITMATWVRPGRATTQELITKATNGATNGYQLALAQSGTAATSQRAFVRFNQVASTDTYRVSATSTYPIDGTWMHVAATYDGAMIRLYINGVQEATLPATVAIATNTLPLSFGAEANGARALQGAMDDIRLYSRALSASEISALVPAAHAPNAPTLNAPTNGATGTTASPTLDVTVTDPDAAPMTVKFFGRTYESGVYTLIGTRTDVVSGATTSVSWPNLAPGQRYQWFATADNGSATTASSTWTFSTQEGSAPVLVGVGDIAGCGAAFGDEATAAVVQGVSGAVFTTGDNVYQNGTATEFAECYQPSWGAVKNRTRPAPGNHDWNTGTLDGYFGYFGASATDADGKSYYSYDVDQQWHVVVLDTECARVGGCGAGSPQDTWLRADLADHAADNVIAIWHKPRFSSGGTNLTELQRLYEDIYYAGVDMLLVGHDHIYERFAPLDPAGNVAANGVRNFTLGTGGAGLSGIGTARTGSEVRRNDTFGVMKLTLHADRYDWQFMPVAGKSFTDSGTSLVHDAVNRPPVITSASIAETSPKTNDTLHVDVVATDADDDQITLAYQWQKDAGAGFADIAGADGSTLDLSQIGNGNRNDQIRVIVTPSDATGSGSPSTTNAVTVGNSAPVATGDAYATDRDTELTVTAPGVLGNDSDADGDPLAAAVEDPATHGLVTLSPNGSFTYTPSAGYSGPDAFTYRAGDGSATSTLATVSISVVGGNRPPVITSASIAETSPKTNDTLHVDVVATDADDDQITLAYQWQKDAGAGFADIAGADGSTLDLSQIGNGNRGDLIRVVVVAADAGSSSDPFASDGVNVLNTVPSFDQDLANRTDAEGTSVSVSASATDPDADALAYDATGLPSGLSINTSTGLISGTIGAGASTNSPYAVSVRVSDNGGATVGDTDMFTWTVSGAPTGGSVAFRSASTGANRTTRTLVVPRPAGVVNGDVMVAVVAVRKNPTATPPQGWTQVSMTPNGTTYRQYVFTKVATGTESTSYTFTFNQSRAASGAIVAYSGVRAQNPVETFTAGTARAAAITAPSATTALNGAMVVGAFSINNSSAIAPPAGMTERGEVASGSKIKTEVADYVQSTAGATGAKTATAAAAAPNIGQLIVLRPA